MDQALSALFVLVGVFLLIIGYLAPSYIAMRRGHHQIGPIFIINLLLGWTVVGWILSLAWSTSWVRRLPRA